MSLLQMRKRIPVSLSAGHNVKETGAPLWTPIPVSDTSLASVVCLAPMKPFMAPTGPRAVCSPYSSPKLPSNPPIDWQTLATNSIRSPSGSIPFLLFGRARQNWSSNQSRRQHTLSVRHWTNHGFLHSITGITSLQLTEIYY